MNTTRTDRIRDRLVNHFTNEVTVAASPMPLADWDAGTKELGPLALFGIGMPLPFDQGKDPIVAPFCPERLAEVTATLDDDFLEAFLDYVEVYVDFQIADFGDVDPALSAQRAEDRLADEYPLTAELFNATRLAWLDSLDILPVVNDQDSSGWFR